MDLLAFAKKVADRVEAEALRAKMPVAVCVIDIHGNVVLKHRMSGAPVFSIELSERKAYTSALVRMRTADLLPLGAAWAGALPADDSVSGQVLRDGRRGAAHQRG